MAELFCKGCGALIQNVDNKLPGYVSDDLLNAKKVEEIICQRCFRIRHYSESFPYTVSNSDYLQVIDKIKSEDALIVKIVDIFDFSGSFVPAIKELTGNEDVILVGNKMDLMPKNVKPSRILSWLQVMLNAQGFTVLDSVLLSAKFGDNFDELMEKIYISIKAIEMSILWDLPMLVNQGLSIKY